MTEFRRAVKDSFKVDEGVSLTYLPFVARALVDALAEFPQVNASMGDEVEQIVVHGSINLGIAVDLDHEGLIVPVVHDIQDQRLRAIARNMAELADRALLPGAGSASWRRWYSRSTWSTTSHCGSSVRDLAGARR